jgi:hypothetical protein
MRDVQYPRSPGLICTRCSGARDGLVPSCARVRFPRIACGIPGRPPMTGGGGSTPRARRHARRPVTPAALHAIAEDRELDGADGDVRRSGFARALTR